MPRRSTESQKRSPAHARRVSSIVLHRSLVANEPSGTEEASRIVFRLATRMWLEALDRVMSEAGAPPSLDCNTREVCHHVSIYTVTLTFNSATEMASR